MIAGDPGDPREPLREGRPDLGNVAVPAALVGRGHAVEIAGEHHPDACRGRDHRVERQLLELLRDRDAEQLRFAARAGHDALQIAARDDRVELVGELGHATARDR